MRDLLADARTALRVDVVRSLVPGGQKQVHVVVDASGEESILKLIDLGRASDPAALERARREVELLRGIDHPNVVKVRSELLELGTPPDAAFWLDEFVTFTARFTNHLVGHAGRRDVNFAVFSRDG